MIVLHLLVLTLLKLFSSAARKTLVEAIDPAATVHYFLFTSVKRMTLGANVNMNLFCHGGPGFNDIATTTGSNHFAVFGLNLSLHLMPHLLVYRHLVLCRAPYIVKVYGRIGERAYYQKPRQVQQRRILAKNPPENDNPICDHILKLSF